ncbi:MAG: NADH-quinone oxidoreductase subunit, partial [Actinomycetota bacterium]
TPCREGTYWITDLLKRLEKGKGMETDLVKIDELCKQIAGRSFCALGDAAATPFPGAMRFFEEEIKQAVTTAVDETFNPLESTVFAKAGVK